MLDDIARRPEAGVAPVSRQNVGIVRGVKVTAVTVIVLPRYPAAGLTEVAVGAPVTVSTVVPVVNKTVAGFVMVT